MNKERRDQILSAGMKAARDRLKRLPQRGEYPHDFSRLYGWLEDALFDLFMFIHRKEIHRIAETAGEIIITSSEIAEYAYTEIDYKKILRGGKRDEISDNKH